MARNSYPGNSTVTILHSRSKNINEICKKADILIVALGKANFVTSEMIKEGACIIDVGITRVPSNKTKSGWKLLGDVDFENVKDKVSYITPVSWRSWTYDHRHVIKKYIISFKIIDKIAISFIYLYLHSFVGLFPLVLINNNKQLWKEQ